MDRLEGFDRAGFEPRPLIHFLPNAVRVRRARSKRIAKRIGQTLGENQSRVAAQNRRGYTIVIGKLAARRVFRPTDLDVAPHRAVKGLLALIKFKYVFIVRTYI